MVFLWSCQKDETVVMEQSTALEDQVPVITTMTLDETGTDFELLSYKYRLPDHFERTRFTAMEFARGTRTPWDLP